MRGKITTKTMYETVYSLRGIQPKQHPNKTISVLNGDVKPTLIPPSRQY
jgi:hypothetical protein